jgi:hypothetical protein
MIRFIFYAFASYIILKMLRLFVDPLFETKTSNPLHTKKNNAEPIQEQRPRVGEYVDFEEVK